MAKHHKHHLVNKGPNERIIFDHAMRQVSVPPGATVPVTLHDSMKALLDTNAKRGDKLSCEDNPDYDESEVPSGDQGDGSSGRQPYVPDSAKPPKNRPQGETRPAVADDDDGEGDAAQRAMAAALRDGESAPAKPGKTPRVRPKQ